MLLLETISQSDPASIRATTNLVDRDYKQVHRNLSELEDTGVTEFEGNGAGHSNTPKLVYDWLQIDIPPI